MHAEKQTLFSGRLDIEPGASSRLRKPGVNLSALAVSLIVIIILSSVLGKLMSLLNPAVGVWTVAHEDAFFALGYLHALDRLWQMDIQRRLAEGKLSEILAKEFANNQIAYALFRAYSKGVNDYSPHSLILSASQDLFWSVSRCSWPHS
jgi:ABC-type transport system involved in cytochrome c biogenesis permease component